ncbi:hypothetical protein OIU74_010235, partial [Salix koriyanagi]
MKISLPGLSVFLSFHIF